MLNLFLTSLNTYGLTNNIFVNTGYGSLLLGREKKYQFFRHINILFLIFGIFICSIATYFVNKFVFVKFELEMMKFGFVIFFAGLYNLLISFLWGKMSRFGQYLYEKSCSYVFDLVFTVFVVMAVDMTVSFVPFLLVILAILIAIYASNLIIGFYIESINKSRLKICVRNVSARLYLLAFFAILLFYLGKLL